MKVYRISGRYVTQPIDADWREQLANRLGNRPRRLGRWAELGLYGALMCMTSGAEVAQMEHAALVLSSQHGPALALRSALAQAREDLPLPVAFLQAQPSQLLAALSLHLGWCGDARFITNPDPFAVLALALAVADSHADGLLVGWVNELESESSHWLRLEPVTDAGGNWQETDDFGVLLRRASYVRLRQSRLAVIIDQKYIHADQGH